MPLDIRQITFSQDETITSIVEYSVKRGDPMPSGIALDLSVRDGKAISAHLMIEDMDRQRESYTISGENLAAALILFCLDRKIPLPRELEKKLKRVDDHRVAILINNNKKIPA